MTDIVKEAREACWKVVSGPSNARLATFLKYIRDHGPDVEMAFVTGLALADEGDWRSTDTGQDIENFLNHLISRLEAQEQTP